MRLWSREEHSHRAAAGIAGNQAARSCGSRSHAQSGGRGGFAEISLARKAGRNFARRTRRNCSTTSARSDKTQFASRHRPQDAGVSAASALCAHAAGGAGIRLRLSGRARRRAHAGPRPAVAQLRQGRGFRARRFARRKGVVGFLDSDARVELMRRTINSAWTPAASSASTPSPRGKSGRCSNNFSASPKTKASTRSRAR